MSFKRFLACIAMMSIAAPVSFAQEAPAGKAGGVSIDITNIIGKDLKSSVDFVPKGGGDPIRVDVPKGKAKGKLSAGEYDAFIYVYDAELPIAVEHKAITIKPGKDAFILVNLSEGLGNAPIRAFDKDGDLFLDRVEESAGTDPADPASYPGAQPVAWKNTVIDKKGGWYAGDLHVRSLHGGGTEKVGDLIRRAEKSGLDFIAITDRNSVASISDPDYKSSKVVLIPAMEWGDEKLGVALLYGMRTISPPTDSFSAAQALVYKVQAQGGVFAIAHPCFPGMPWQRGLSYVNAMEVWCHAWRGVPPISPQSLTDPNYRLRNKKGDLVYSMSVAAATSNLSANGQAELFWDKELESGLRASPIAGSMSSSPEVPMGEPVTFVYAEEKSTEGILDGLRRGRTYLCAKKDGPRVLFMVDINADEKVDIGLSGVIPAVVNSAFIVQFKGAKGHKAQVLCNGLPIITKNIESDSYTLRFLRQPKGGDVYRVRVVATQPPGGNKEGFGALDVLAMSAPIYAREMLIVDPKKDVTDMWVELQNTESPPMYAESARSPSGRPVVNTTQEQDFILKLIEPQQLDKVVNVEPKVLNK